MEKNIIGTFFFKWRNKKQILRLLPGQIKCKNNPRTKVLDKKVFVWIFTINLLNIEPYCLFHIVYELWENSFIYVVPIWIFGILPRHFFSLLCLLLSKQREKILTHHQHLVVEYYMQWFTAKTLLMNYFTSSE